MTKRAAGATMAVVLATGVAGGAGAQTSPPASVSTPGLNPVLPGPRPTPTPTPPRTTPAPLRVPGLEGYSLPSDVPTGVATPGPVSTPTPTPAPVPTARAPRRVPAPEPGPLANSTSAPTTRPRPTARADDRAEPALPAVTPTPLPTPSSVPSPVPAPVATPTPLPTTAPVAAPSPTPTPPPAPAPPAPAQDDAGVWSWWWVLGGVIVLAAAAFAWSRRRTRGARDDAPTVASPPVRSAPSARPEPVPVAPVAPPAPRARLAIDLLPQRGGLTLISLVFEGELLVRNTGDAPASRIAVEASLLSARSGQDEELGALFARPVARPAVAPFALAPGEERRVRIVAALPRAGIEPLVAGGRQMVVPVLAANVVYATGEGGAGEQAEAGQTAASWIVGVARPGSDKLAPFWLDTGGLTDTLAARPHALAVAR